MIKKVVLLFVSVSFLISCSKDEEPENSDVYYQLEGDEFKVESFKVNLTGNTEIRYSIYDVVLDEDVTLEERESRGALIETKELVIENDTSLYFNGGLRYFEIENLNPEKYGEYYIYLNDTWGFAMEMRLTMRFGSRERNINEFLIPYKFSPTNFR